MGWVVMWRLLRRAPWSTRGGSCGHEGMARWSSFDREASRSGAGEKGSRKAWLLGGAGVPPLLPSGLLVCTWWRGSAMEALDEGVQGAVAMARRGSGSLHLDQVVAVASVAHASGGCAPVCLSGAWAAARHLGGVLAVVRRCVEEPRRRCSSCRSDADEVIGCAAA